MMETGLAVSKRERICWGTEGSNPPPSSGESVANLPRAGSLSVFPQSWRGLQQRRLLEWIGNSQSLHLREWCELMHPIAALR